MRAVAAAASSGSEGDDGRRAEEPAEGAVQALEHGREAGDGELVVREGSRLDVRAARERGLEGAGEGRVRGELAPHVVFVEPVVGVVKDAGGGGAGGRGGRREGHARRKEANATSKKL